VEEDYEIAVKELKRLLDKETHVNLIDVREPHEHELCHINGSRLIPAGQIPNRVIEFDPAEEYIFYCHVGERSGWAVSFLRQLGFKKVKNVLGGVDAWAVEIDPTMPRY
jgi:adenylyltransferase/sulfurtransferase